jgi:hypothetical protein
VDHDFVDAGNSVRWPLGLSTVGMPKVEALGGFIAGNYPYTSVSNFPVRIGAPRLDDAEVASELDTLDQILDGADMIYDATAEPGVWYALSELARELHIPYVQNWATAGAWGGVVARITPTTGCWLCLEHHFADGSIRSPSADPAGTIQPTGCADPTFTGTSFDLSALALSGVRLAVSTLCQGAVGAYPDSAWDVEIIDLRDETGQPLETVDTYHLTSHVGCPRCVH